MAAQSKDKKIFITEVGPRDGLQNESAFLPTDIKIEFLRRLSETGVASIEATSFVANHKIPQLSDASEVYTAIQNFTPQYPIVYSALVPNMQGMEHALISGVKKIAVFTAASETFTQNNIHCSINESLARFSPVINSAKDHHLKIRGYVSCALGCPYEGKILPQKVLDVARKLFDLGCDEIDIGDTIGVGTPEKTKCLIELLAQHIPIEKLVMHFHDTYGQALANIYASLQCGITSFDSSVSGLGGCPYAKGASGNVATEDVLYLMQGLGIKTNISLPKMIEVGNFISKALNRPTGSKVAQALTSH